MTPDGYIRDYLSRSRRGALGLNFVDSTGRVYLKRCQKCKYRHRHWSSQEKAWVCGHCGVIWKYRSRYMLKGEVQVTPNPGVASAVAVDIATIGVLLDRWLRDPHAARWHARLYLYKVGTETGLELMVREGKPPELRACPYPWTRWRVGEAIREGRREWVRRLSRAGLPVD